MYNFKASLALFSLFRSLRGKLIFSVREFFFVFQLLWFDGVVPRHDQIPAEAGVLLAHQGFCQGEGRTRHL